MNPAPDPLWATHGAGWNYVQADDLEAVRALHHELEMRLEGLLTAPHWPPWIEQPGKLALMRMVNAAFEDSLRIKRLYTRQEVLAEFG